RVLFAALACGALLGGLWAWEPNPRVVGRAAVFVALGTVPCLLAGSSWLAAVAARAAGLFRRPSAPRGPGGGAGLGRRGRSGVGQGWGGGPPPGGARGGLRLHPPPPPGAPAPPRGGAARGAGGGGGGPARAPPRRRPAGGRAGLHRPVPPPRRAALPVRARRG